MNDILFKRKLKLRTCPARPHWNIQFIILLCLDVKKEKKILFLINKHKWSKLLYPTLCSKLSKFTLPTNIILQYMFIIPLIHYSIIYWQHYIILHFAFIVSILKAYGILFLFHKKKSWTGFKSNTKKWCISSNK